ncbi:hypothetical protein S245_044106, partial [Arachis hypogaea]
CPHNTTQLWLGNTRVHIRLVYCQVCIRELVLIKGWVHWHWSWCCLLWGLRPVVEFMTFNFSMQ